MAENKDYYVTVVDGAGQKVRILKSQVERYRKQQEEFQELYKKATKGSQNSPLYEIVEIIED